jgi:hypothetical protein
MSEGVVFVRARLTPCRDRAPGAIPATTFVRTPTVSVRVSTVAPGSCRWSGSVVVGTSPALPTATDEHVLADLDSAAAASLRICDVIVQNAGVASRTSHPSDAPYPLAARDARLARIFARYHGCAVAAIALGTGDHLVGLRDGRSIRFARPSAGQTGAARSGEGDSPTRSDTGTSTAAVCASLVHVWMASGRRIDALNSATVVATAGPRWEVHLIHVPD